MRNGFPKGVECPVLVSVILDQNKHITHKKNNREEVANVHCRSKKKRHSLAPERIELTTFALLARRSNQLSYGAACIKDRYNAIQISTADHTCNTLEA